MSWKLSLMPSVHRIWMGSKQRHYGENWGAILSIMSATRIIVVDSKIQLFLDCPRQIGDEVALFTRSVYLGFNTWSKSQTFFVSADKRSCTRTFSLSFFLKDNKRTILRNNQKGLQNATEALSGHLEWERERYGTHRKNKKPKRTSNEVFKTCIDIGIKEEQILLSTYQEGGGSRKRMDNIIISVSGRSAFHHYLVLYGNTSSNIVSEFTNNLLRLNDTFFFTFPSSLLGSFFFLPITAS